MNIHPTNAEMEILQVLWKYGPSTVRFVNDKLNEEKRTVQYSATLKLMQIMAEKKMVDRDETNMKHIYSAAIAEDTTKKDLLGRFVENVFNGSASKLMMQLLANKKTSRKELEEIRNLIDKLEEEE
ncbi:BlaI/MecI/CopY family transcriptional regulator [[Flexibacter] sp. ATCC 35208]|uniref:BlaI/MecI/CopY family transcriptional regulator n=1 Tax=[Flexibacter] sp. ATCC 35208 TaxID=1936242 RepID=UPI0009CF8987|nr:BlaI/MecI/CopY family transcriptional regulator [[Flexibacter] sp. ATCC 35208]OMP77900.1 transcriptional regulator [[Flexibacter] sp. ATCC 35208]